MTSWSVRHSSGLQDAGAFYTRSRAEAVEPRDCGVVVSLSPNGVQIVKVLLAHGMNLVVVLDAQGLNLVVGVVVVVVVIGGRCTSSSVPSRLKSPPPPTPMLSSSQSSHLSPRTHAMQTAEETSCLPMSALTEWTSAHTKFPPLYVAFAAIMLARISLSSK